MTRINVGIDPERLTDCHLRAEYREIQRLPSNYRASVRSGSINRLPKKFTLGKGHVLWCLGQWWFCTVRYILLHKEYTRRFDNTENRLRIFTDLVQNNTVRHEHYSTSYTPTPEDRQLLIDRITERITNSPKKYWHYYGERITPEQAIELLTKDM